MIELLFGFEGEFSGINYISAAIIGAERNHPLMKDLMNYYDNEKEFSYEHKDNNSFIITNILEEKYALNTNNNEQLLENGIHVYSKEILNRPSKESKAIHIVTATWNKGALSKRNKIIKRILSICNTKEKLKLYIIVLNIYHKLRDIGKRKKEN